MGRKRMTLIAIAMIGIITMTGCGSKEEEKLKVRIAHDNNVNTPLHKAFLKYEELVEERSDGKIDIILFPGSQMGSVQDTFEQCRRGDIEMSGSTTSNFIQAIPELAVWESFYLFDDSAHAKRVFESEIGKKMLEPLERMDLQAADSTVVPLHHLKETVDGCKHGVYTGRCILLHQLTFVLNHLFFRHYSPLFHSSKKCTYIPDIFFNRQITLFFID